MASRTKSRRVAATSAARELRIEYVALSKLRRYPQNAKKHDLRLIHESVERFGLVAPPIVNEETGELLVGHGRLDALEQKRRLGAEPPAGVKVNGQDWLVPVVRGVSLARGEHGAYSVADNRLTEAGGWDATRLPALLAQIAETTAGLRGVGYTPEDVARLTATAKEAAAAAMPDMEIQPNEHWDYIVLVFRDQRDWLRAQDVLGIQRVNYGVVRRGIGLGRCIDGAAALKRMEGVP